MNNDNSASHSNINASSAERKRIAEIEAELLAYSEGWMQFDEEHVKHLQRERIALLRSTDGSDTAERTPADEQHDPDDNSGLRP